MANTILKPERFLAWIIHKCNRRPVCRQAGTMPTGRQALRREEKNSPCLRWTGIKNAQRPTRKTGKKSFHETHKILEKIITKTRENNWGI